MNLGIMRRRHRHVTNEDSYPKIISFNNNTYYTRASSDDLSVNERNSENYIGIVIDLGQDVQFDSIEFSCGIQTNTARLMAYDSYGENQLQHIYRPSPRTVTGIGAIKTIYYSVYIDEKESAYIKIDGNYIFNGATFDWSKYLE